VSESQEENKGLIRRLYDAQTKGDPHAIEELLAPTSTIIGLLPAARAAYRAMPWFMMPSPVSVTSSRSRWRPKATGW